MGLKPSVRPGAEEQSSTLEIVDREQLRRKDYNDLEDEILLQ